MSGLTVKLDGLNALEKRMSALGNDIATKIGQSANRAGAAYMQKKMIAAAPNGPDAEGSIRKRKRKNGAVRTEKHAKIKNNLKVKKVKEEAGKVTNAITVGKAYHAMYLEFGSIHNTPQPFMSQTFATEQQGAIDAIAKVLNRRLTKAGV